MILRLVGFFIQYRPVTDGWTDTRRQRILR